MSASAPAPGRPQPPVGVHAAAHRAGPLGGLLTEVEAYAAAVLLASLAAILVTRQWSALGRAGQAAVLAALALLLAAVGIAALLVRPRARAALLEPAHAVRRRLAGTALTLAGASAAGAVAVAVGAHGTLAGALTAAATILVTAWLAPGAVSEAAALGSLCALAAAGLLEAGASWTARALTVGGIGVAWALLSRTRVLTVPALALVLGSAVAVLSAGSVAGPAVGVLLTVLAVTVAATILVRRRGSGNG